MTDQTPRTGGGDESSRRRRRRSGASLNEALRWIGSRVDDINGAGIGRLEDIWVDPIEGEPRWLLVKEGRFGGRHTLLPFAQISAGGGRVAVPFERRHVRSAPEVRPGAPLSADLERSLAEHYAAAASIPASEPAPRDQLDEAPLLDNTELGERPDSVDSPTEEWDVFDFGSADEDLEITARRGVDLPAEPRIEPVEPAGPEPARNFEPVDPSGPVEPAARVEPLGALDPEGWEEETGRGRGLGDGGGSDTFPPPRPGPGYFRPAAPGPPQHEPWAAVPSQAPPPGPSPQAPQQAPRVPPRPAVAAFRLQPAVGPGPAAQWIWHPQAGWMTTDQLQDLMRQPLAPQVGGSPDYIELEINGRIRISGEVNYLTPLRRSAL